MRRAKRGEAGKWLGGAIAYDGDDCLVWPFAVTEKGYGSVRLSDRTLHAHRAVCLAVYGEPKEGQTDAAHSCGNKLCCNPKHVRFSTPAENQADKIEHGTSLRGVKNPKARLAAEVVPTIRADLIAGARQADIADKYGITIAAVSAIHRRKTWAWLS